MTETLAPPRLEGKKKLQVRTTTQRPTGCYLDVEHLGKEHRFRKKGHNALDPEPTAWIFSRSLEISASDVSRQWKTQPGFVQSPETLSNASAPTQTMRPPSIFTVSACAAAHNMAQVILNAFIIDMNDIAQRLFAAIIAHGGLLHVRLLILVKPA